MAPRAQLLKKNAWLQHLIRDKAPLAARDSDVFLVCIRHGVSETVNIERYLCFVRHVQQVAMSEIKRPLLHKDELDWGVLLLNARTQRTTLLLHTQLFGFSI